MSLLTSHSDAVLHEKVFSSVVSRFSDSYMSEKKQRPFIQDLVPYFINSSLRELEFGKSRMLAEAEMCQVCKFFVFPYNIVCQPNTLLTVFNFWSVS